MFVAGLIVGIAGASLFWCFITAWFFGQMARHIRREDNRLPWEH